MTNHKPLNHCTCGAPFRTGHHIHYKTVDTYQIIRYCSVCKKQTIIAEKVMV